MRVHTTSERDRPETLNISGYGILVSLAVAVCTLMSGCDKLEKSGADSKHSPAPPDHSGQIALNHSDLAAVSAEDRERDEAVTDPGRSKVNILDMWQGGLPQYGSIIFDSPSFASREVGARMFVPQEISKAEMVALTRRFQPEAEKKYGVSNCQIGFYSDRCPDSERFVCFDASKMLFGEFRQDDMKTCIDLQRPDLLGGVVIENGSIRFHPPDPGQAGMTIHPPLRKHYDEIKAAMLKPPESPD